MPKKLLLADDSVTIQRVIELTFSGEDVQVLAVSDGEEAIRRIAADKPDIVLADIGMPKRSGYEVSAFVKNNPDLEKIPVLLLAGAFEPVDDVRAKEAKCDGVLVKPFEPQHVIARVRELIGGAKGSPTQSAVPDIPRPAAALASPRPVELPRREDRPAVPDDLMDLGEEDLLPRIAEVETHPQPLVIDDSLDDYFDKLDEAFSTISTSAPAKPDRPVVDNDLQGFDEPPMLPASMGGVEAIDPFAGLDAIEPENEGVPTLDDLLSDMAPAPETRMPITFDAAPPPVIDLPPMPPPAAPTPPQFVAPPPIEPPDLTPTLSPSIPAARLEPVPSRVEGPASSRSIIADAFSALLAAEEGEPGAAPPRLGGNGSPAAVTDTMIDDVARRVIERLALGSSDQMQAMVKEIVSSVAERLVREEIDRIRRNAPRS